VAVFAEERLDDIQNAAIRDGGMTSRAMVEHFVAEFVPGNVVRVASANIRGETPEYTEDVLPHECDLPRTKDFFQHQIA